MFKEFIQICLLCCYKWVEVELFQKEKPADSTCRFQLYGYFFMLKTKLIPLIND